jgi:hypothetical protein
MRFNQILFSATVVTLMLASPRALCEGTGSPPALNLVKGSILWLEGDSTLHKYRLNANQLQVISRMEMEGAGGGAGLEALAAKGGLKSLEVSVAVLGLTSGESGLDENMRKALSAGQYHEIRFRMDSYQSQPGAEAGALALRIKGRLQIAAVEKPIEIDAVAVTDGQAMHVTGTKELLMTDYGVKPPKFMLGAMSVRDPVTVHLDLRLER